MEKQTSIPTIITLQQNIWEVDTQKSLTITTMNHALHHKCPTWI